MFVSSIVAAVIAITPDKPISVTPAYFLRDVIFYLICLSLLLYAILVREQVDIFISSALLSIYVR